MNKNPHIKNFFSAEEEDCLSLEQMKSYQAGSLVGEEKHFAERHLLNCELCAMSFEGIAELDAAAVEAGAASISAAAWDRVAVRERRRKAGAWVWISAAASVALIIGLSFFVLRTPGQEERMKTLAEGLYEAPKTPPPAAFRLNDSADLLVAIEKNGLRLAEAKTNENSPNEEFPKIGGNKYKEPVSALNDQVATSSIIKNDINAVGQVETKAPAPAPAPISKNELEVIPELTFADEQGGRIDLLEEDMEIEEDADNMGGISDEEILFKDVSNMEITDKEQANEFLSDAKAVKQRSNTALDGHDDFAEVMSEKNEDRTLSSVMVKRQQGDVRKERNRVKDKADHKRNNKAGKAKSVSRNAPGELGNIAVSTDSTISLFDQGLDAYRRGRFQESADLLRKTASASPSNLEAHYYAAASFMNMDQAQAALYHLNRVLAVPGNSLYIDAEWYKALAYLKLNERKKAKALLEKIELDGGKHAAPARKALKAL
ncbi:MAG TPA: hypothetical protein ENJ82_07445 [Bacteroidetes bacterium]|nr:hypothetical protein [Bacteroidota bacterium]